MLFWLHFLPAYSFPLYRQVWVVPERLRRLKQWINQNLFYLILHQYILVPGGQSTAACAKATRADFSASPIRILPVRARIMYLASTFLLFLNNFWIIATLRSWDWKEVDVNLQLHNELCITLFPVIWVSSLNDLNTSVTVKLIGVVRVRWLFRDF